MRAVCFKIFSLCSPAVAVDEIVFIIITKKRQGNNISAVFFNELCHENDYLFFFGSLLRQAVGEYFCFVAVIFCASACSVGYQPFALIAV